MQARSREREDKSCIRQRNPSISTINGCAVDRYATRLQLEVVEDHSLRTPVQTTDILHREWIVRDPSRCAFRAVASCARDIMIGGSSALEGPPPTTVCGHYDKVVGTIHLGQTAVCSLVLIVARATATGLGVLPQFLTRTANSPH